MGPDQGHAILSINGRTDARSRLDPECGVEIFQAPKKRSSLRFPRDLWSLIREISPRVLLTYNWGATDAIIGARAARFFPVVHNECGLSNEIDGKAWRRRVARRLLLPGCYRTVVTAKALYDIARESFGVPVDKIVYIKTGVDTERFHPHVNTTLRTRLLGESNDAGVIVGYVGSLRPSKNVARLLRTFAAVRRPDDRFAIFGGGPEESALKELSSALNLGTSVHFCGHFDDVSQAYAAMDVAATASRSEAASNSLLESMASGLPVLSTDIADNRLLLAPENRAFVFDDPDESGFVEGMRRLINEPETRQRLGDVNRERVVREYPLDRMFREYADLWNTAASLSNDSHKDLVSQPGS